MAEQDPGGDGTAPVDVRLLSPDEWQVAREARLAALRNAPESLLPRQPHESSWTEESWRRSCETGLWAVAEDADLIIGLARLAREYPAAHVESVWTHPGHRRRGVASALVRELVAVERKRGPGDVFVWVIQPNPAALRLYMSLGFEPTGELQPLDGLGRVEERLRLSGAVREE
jgi:ribosomal protein S18 acetylase RimI-like enzyme